MINSNTDFSPWPNFSKQEVDAVAKVLSSNKVNYWTGNKVKKFEVEFAEFIGCNYAIAIANGTLALELALRVLNIKKGDEVIVTPRSFIASTSCVITVGAKPIFADIDSNSGNIVADSISQVISAKTKAIICVHLAGFPCEMDDIVSLAKKNNIAIIEDCAQAHGAKYKNNIVGSIGDIGVWSFCQDKIITTGGEGGMIATNNKLLADKMFSYKDHGKSKIVNSVIRDGFRWSHNSFGSNYRMTEMQAVIGSIQLKKLPHWLKLRLNNASKIWLTASKYKSLIVPEIPHYIVHSAYKAYIEVDESLLNNNWNASKIRDEINNNGVPCFSGSCPEVYLEKAFDNKDFKPKKRLKNAKSLSGKTLMFLTHPSLSRYEMDKFCSILDKIMQQADKTSNI